MKKHWTLAAPPDIAKFFPLHGKFGVRLSSDNYIAWAHVAETSLRSLGVFMYCNGELPKPDDDDDAAYWLQMDMLIQGILLSNMEPHIIADLDWDITAEKLWTEA